MKKIVIIGFGGHARSVIDTVIHSKEYEIAGYIDKKDNGEYCNIRWLGNDNMLPDLYDRGVHNAVVGIGYMGKSDIRKKLYVMLKKIGFSLPAVVDESAIVAANTFIGEGTFVGKKAVINANATVGDMCIINTASVIEHDCCIKKYTHVAVGAVVCGGTTIGESSLIGAGSSIIQGISIGDNCIIGAGSTVIGNVKDNSKKYGLVKGD